MILHVYRYFFQIKSSGNQVSQNLCIIEKKVFSRSYFARTLHNISVLCSRSKSFDAFKINVMHFFELIFYKLYMIFFIISIVIITFKNESSFVPFNLCWLKILSNKIFSVINDSIRDFMRKRIRINMIKKRV